MCGKVIAEWREIIWIGESSCLKEKHARSYLGATFRHLTIIYALKAKLKSELTFEKLRNE